MGEKRVWDKSGNILTVLDINGTWYPRTFNPETLTDIPNLPLWHDDIFLCGYPRSGHHWVYEILKMLLSGTSEYVQQNMERCVLELEPKSVLETLPSPRVLTTHVLPHTLPGDHRKKAVKTVYVIRDPRDVAVSWFYFYQAYPGDPYEGDWDDWLDLFTRDKFLWSTWFEHVRSFESFFSSLDPSLFHIVFYDDLQKYPLEETKRLASFLDKPLSDDILMDIVNRCTFENMKPEKIRIDREWHGRNAQYRKGIVGDWKNIFTIEQEELFSEIYKKKMEGSTLKWRYHFINPSTEHRNKCNNF